MATINFWRKFKNIFPDSPTIFGKVTAIAAGRSTVQTPAGGILTALGDSVPVGQNAYVKDGVIQGQAPQLPHYDIEV